MFKRRVILLVILMATLQPVVAAVDWQLPRGSRVVFQEEGEQENYLLMLGIYRRINNEWRKEGAELISGHVNRQTIEMAPGIDEFKAYQLFKDQLSPNHRRELFSCSGLLCGTSNAWANTHFQRAMLYGLDNNQHYGVFETESVQGEVNYTVIYSVKRGNGSVLVQLERIQVPASERGRLVTSANSIGVALDEFGYFSIPLSYSDQTGLQVSEAQVNALVNYMNAARGQSFVLVGHDYAKTSTSLSLAEKHANDLLLLLKQNRLRATVTVFSVGNLAPAGRGRQSVRVDLVRQ